MSNSKLVFHMITAKEFWTGAPLVISEIVRRGHYLSVFDENALPPKQSLLTCDVVIDMSTITDKRFYSALGNRLHKLASAGRKVPLMVDPPEAVIASLDKRETHALFRDLIPETYSLTGKNNAEKIHRFDNDNFIVVKKPIGWGGKYVERLTPLETLQKYGNAKDVIVQKYLPSTRGIGRIVTINHNDDFELACSYSRFPRENWRTGTDVDYECRLEPITPELYEFARHVSRVSGLYLNGIDYISSEGHFFLLEVNAVPAMREALVHFGIDIPHALLSHIERNADSHNKLGK